MKAAVLYGREDLRVEDVPRLPLQTGEVRVRVEVALTCGTDLKVFKRGYHARMIQPPALFGHELSGVIEEVADQVADWRVGDRVVVANSAPCGVCFYCGHAQENLCEDLLFLNGAYAESIVVPSRLVLRNMVRLPDGMAFRDAALTEPLACVVKGMEDLNLQRGQRVAIIGSGPIGLMFVALTADLGCAVTVFGRGTRRLEQATLLGAAQVVDIPRDTPVTEVAKAGRSFDAVIEAVGQPASWEQAVTLVRRGGVVNFFGGCPTGTTISLDTGLIHYSGLTLLASFHHTPATIRQALRFIEKGLIRAGDFVDGTCPLDELPDLFRSMAQGNRTIKTAVQTGVTPSAK